MTKGTAPGRHVVVIGAGIVGACTAISLLRRGHRVTILDPAPPGGPQGASFGNGAFISPASIIPMSTPGLWKRVPGYLIDRGGALTIRWRYLPRLAPWLWRFLWAGATAARVERTARLLNGLLADAPARHLQLAAGTGQAGMIAQTGLIYAFADRAAFQTESASWALRRANGVALREMGPEEIAEQVPGLSRDYRFAVMVTEGAHCRDPGGYVAGLIAQAAARGAQLIPTRATGFRIEAGRLMAVHSEAGEIPCDGAVIAAGIAARDLARAAGDAVPLEAERGYHVEIKAPVAGPRIPVMPQDGKMANVMTAHGFRAAGQVELASADAAPDWRRAAILLAHLERTYPALRGQTAAMQVSRWQGNRPSTPDGLPVLGRARAAPQIIHAFGHGHVGLASAPISGEIAAALIDGTQPPLDITAFSAARFRR